MAFGHSCTSSRNNSVLPGIISMPINADNWLTIRPASRSASKPAYKLEIFKINLCVVWNSRPKCLTELDFPTCRAPRRRIGLWSALFAHSSRYLSMILFRYMLIYCVLGYKVTKIEKYKQIIRRFFEKYKDIIGQFFEKYKDIIGAIF